MLRLQGGEAPALFLDISLFLFLILYQGVYRLYRGVCKLHPPAFDDCGSVSMQNDECKMQNEGNPQFCILHLSFCIHFRSLTTSFATR